MNPEHGAAVEHPHLVPEAGVGVLVEDLVGAEKVALPPAAGFDVTHRDRDVIERWKGHGVDSSPSTTRRPRRARDRMCHKESGNPIRPHEGSTGRPADRSENTGHRKRRG
jgi:hypothetical protein